MTGCLEYQKDTTPAGLSHSSTCLNLTRQTRDVAIAAMKIVFPQPTCQLLYLAHARVNTMKEGLPGSCIYGDWPLCVVKK